MIPSRHQVSKERPARKTFARGIMREQTTNLVAHWPLAPERQDGGDKLAELVSKAANQSATPASVIWNQKNRSPAGLLAPEFDGSTSTIDLYSAQLNTDMSWTDFTVSLWFRIGQFADWQTASKQQILYIAADGSNLIDISKSATADQIDFIYSGAGTSDTINGSTLDAGESPVKWMHLAVTVSDSNGDSEMKGFINGAQVSSTQTGIGVWSGAIDSDLCVLGSSALAVPADQLSAGSLLAEVTLWDAVLTASEIKMIYLLK